MPDNTNVNNNASVVVVGRTAPVPPGQQKSDKSVPVVIASDQSTIPVAEQNKVQSEVALSLLGIPRSEVALGIFADVNTYDVNPTEWAAQPDQFTTVPVGTDTPYNDGIEQDMGWGLTHVPEESGALVEAPADRTAILTSKRFFRYQPGRVSAATFGVKTTVMNVDTNDATTNPSVSQKQDIGSTVYNPAIRKYGIFDNFDGYYWETRNNGQGDNFCVVRRTQSLLFNNPLDFAGTGGQTEDFGATNPLDLTAPRGNETPDNLTVPNPNTQISFLPAGNRYPDGHNSTPPGFENVKLGDLVIYRDNLMMIHAGAFDPSLLQEEQEYTFGTDASEDELLFSIKNDGTNSGLGRSITGAVYDIDTGLMTVTTHGSHGFQPSKFVTLAGIGMTCQYSYPDFNGGGGDPIESQIKTYPDRTHGYNILEVPSADTFIVNVGVSTVPTFYNTAKSVKNHARVIGLSTGQYVTYSKGAASSAVGGLTDQKIYRVNKIDFDAPSETVKVQLKDLSEKMGSATPDVGLPQTAVGISGGDIAANVGHKLITPVPFVQPVADDVVDGKNTYESAGGFKRSGLFPYMYTDPNDATKQVGYVDTTLDTQTTNVNETKNQISVLNLYYRNWVNQNIKKEFWNVYEYRVPRSRFSGDRLDNATDTLLFSDVTAENRAGSVVRDSVGAITQDTSIWDLEFDKVTMYKIEFSWYGAVGALFLAYVPVGAGEARWVRVHHLRASNQLKGSSLGNATLPITYLVYGGGGGLNRYGYPNDLDKRSNTSFGYGSSSEHIIKYGASYYIDGGDRGTVKLFSHGTQTGQTIFGSKRTFTVAASGNDKIIRSTTTMEDANDPYITGGSAVGFTSSYYVGAKIITGNPLDQNIEVVYVDTTNNRLHLNAPFSVAPSNGSTIDIIANRPRSLIGLKCRDFIVSSQGKAVRNRTQVYPTRLSTGSEGSVIKVDLLKTPIFQTTSTVSGSFSITTANVDIGKRGKPTLISTPSNPNYLAEGTGAYGYMLGRFSLDGSNKRISVLGYLERRGSTSPTPGYYFNALESTSDSIILISTADTIYSNAANAKFLHEGQLSPEGVGFTTSVFGTDSTLDPLSSIKVSPDIRAPIPKTGTIVASLFIPASGEDFDLSSYFDFNKEYLSFPLTNVIESLYVVGSSDKEFNPSAGISTTSASITWEEQ